MRKWAIFFLMSLPAFAQQPEAARSPGVLSTPGGRYVLGQISVAAKHQYLLDTQTGRVWNVVTDGDGGILVLQPVKFMQPDGERSALPDVKWVAPEDLFKGMKKVPPPKK